jgi:hypothetical protein
MDFNETIILDAQSLKKTKEGYLLAEPRVARAGVQVYRGVELGRPDLGTVRVYRPEDSVFDRASMTSFAYRPITIGHKTLVKSENWRDFAVGTTGGDVVRDGEYLRVSMMVADAEAIDLIQNHHKELSVGYLAEIEWKDGKTPAGEDYDAIQTNIRANHVAVVAQARGGSKLRLGDNAEENNMPEVKTKNFTVDGIDLQLGETEGAVVVRSFTRIADELKAANTKVADLQKQIGDGASEVTTLKKTIEAKDGEIAIHKKNLEDAKLTPEQLDARVGERLAVATKVKAILGDSFSIAGKSDADLRRLCVVKKLGEDMVKTMSDGHIEGAFITMVADLKATGNVQHLADAFSPNSSHNLNDGRSSDAEGAWAERQQRYTNAWQGPKAVA